MTAPAFTRRLLLCLLGAGTLLIALSFSSTALAASPWWHLASSARPSNLSSGTAKDEVLKLTVKATKGDMFLVDTNRLSEFEAGLRPELSELIPTVVPFNASAAQLQEGLRASFPGHEVQVSGGGGEYQITFPDQAFAFVNKTLLPITVSGAFATAFGGEELEGEISIEEVQKGSVDGQVILTAANLGDADVSGGESQSQLADRLPAGLKAVSIEAVAGESEEHKVGAVDCALQTLSCKYKGTLAPYNQIEVRIGVVVQPSAVSGAVNEFTVSGGDGFTCSAVSPGSGAFSDAGCVHEGGSASFARSPTGPVPLSSLRRPLTVSSLPTSFGVEDYELGFEEEGGAPDTQAGSHPFQFTTSLLLNQTAVPQPAALAKDINFKLPPGLIGNPTPFAQCTDRQFLTRVREQDNLCPPASMVGMARVTINEPLALHLITLELPVFNLQPRVGEPARFGFLVLVTPVYIDTSVRTGSDYGITATVSNISQSAGFFKNEVTFWGVPGDPRHDPQRGWGCLEVANGKTPNLPCQPQQQTSPPPFMVMPTSCTGELQTSVTLDSWDHPENLLSSGPGEALPSMDGCNRLPFTPSLKVTPDGQAASTPTGLTVDEHVPQESLLVTGALAQSDVKGLSVTLPAGVVLNPAAADGLQACSMAQISLKDSLAPTCPDASKVATVKIKTPFLTNPLQGSAYLASPQNFAAPPPENPFQSLVAMYIFAEDPVSGVRVKAAGEVSPDPVTGQLTAHFEADPLFAGESESSQFLPQTAFEDVELHFFGGDRAPLGTPAQCGPYTTTGTFTPWSANATTASSSTFDISSGPNGAPCQNPLPFNPTLTAGTTNVQAGAFSALTTTIGREDGQQDLQGVTLHMPPGLSGMLSSVKLCPEAQANAGSCGPESEIGETTVSVGLGGDPFTVTGGKVYITEKYAGAPFGLSIVNPAKAGPFDLGKVVVRAKIEVDPHTAALTITTDASGPHAIPHILDGIPLQIRHVNVNVDRPGFSFNPTNCNAMALTGTVTSTQTAASALSVPFQVTDCAALKFAPKFQVSTSARTSKANGASLTAKVSYPNAPQGTQADITKVKVELPRQLPSRLTTLQKACTAAQFQANPAGCPSESIIGHAVVHTPLLPVALTGPAYFVSHGGEAFPSLIMVLQGYGVSVELVGTTFISKSGVTSTTFKTVPDVPFNTFELTLTQGRFSALTSNLPASAKGSFCGQRLVMPAEFLSQSGALVRQSTPVSVTGCAKAKLTRAQRLAQAMRACKKKARAKRASCQKQARRRYGAVKKKEGWEEGIGACI